MGQKSQGWDWGSHAIGFKRVSKRLLSDSEWFQSIEKEKPFVSTISYFEARFADLLNHGGSNTIKS